MKRYLLAVLFLAILSMGIYAYREFTRKPADLNKSDAVDHLTASDLYMLYSNYEDSANKQYAGKVIEVTGTVTDIENEQDTLLTIMLGDTLQSGRISCLLDKNHMTAAKNKIRGDVVKIKGICTGYLMDVELNRCVIVK